MSESEIFPGPFEVHSCCDDSLFQIGSGNLVFASIFDLAASRNRKRNTAHLLAASWSMREALENWCMAFAKEDVAIMRGNGNADEFFHVCAKLHEKSRAALAAAEPAKE